jgi:hypothetical protein
MLTADLLLTKNVNAPAGIFDSEPSAAQPGTTQALDDSLNLIHDFCSAVSCASDYFCVTFSVTS